MNSNQVKLVPLDSFTDFPYDAARWKKAYHPSLRAIFMRIPPWSLCVNWHIKFPNLSRSRGNARLLGKPTLARHFSNHLRGSCFMTGGPEKEHRRNTSNRKMQERSKGDTRCPTTSQNPLAASVLAEQGRHHQEGLSQNGYKDNPETHHHKTKTASHEQSSSPGFPYLLALLPAPPSDKKFCFVSVSPQTIHFKC